jgi:Fe-S-cluster-containing hydrogenase component 2
MAFVITEPCIDHMDQSCVAVCPVDAITNQAGVDRKMFIDPDTCINCGSCQSVCPNAAVYAADQLPPDFADYSWIDAAWFRDPVVAREVMAEVMAQPLSQPIGEIR